MRKFFFFSLPFFTRFVNGLTFFSLNFIFASPLQIKKSSRKGALFYSDLFICLFLLDNDCRSTEREHTADDCKRRGNRRLTAALLALIGLFGNRRILIPLRIQHNIFRYHVVFKIELHRASLVFVPSAEGIALSRGSRRHRNLRIVIDLNGIDRTAAVCVKRHRVLIGNPLCMKIGILRDLRIKIECGVACAALDQ